MSLAGGRGEIRAARIDGVRELATFEPLPLHGWDGGAPGLPSTEVRIGHDGQQLIVAFRGDYDLLNVDPAAGRDRPVPRLWERDVVELFVSDAAHGTPYHEIEASPLGQWLTLRFDAVRIAATAPPIMPLVTACLGDGELEVVIRLSLSALRTVPAASEPEWRLGLYRIAGLEPDRTYLAQQPTGTLVPDFHQPGAWARLILE